MRAIADDVWQLPLLPRDAINVYLIGDVLVDTGVKQSADKIAAMLDRRSISAIALSHAHEDHAGAMNRLAARFGVPVWCGASDREAAQTGRVVLAPSLQPAAPGRDRPRRRGVRRRAGRPQPGRGRRAGRGIHRARDARAFTGPRLVLARGGSHADLRRRLLQMHLLTTSPGSASHRSCSRRIPRRTVSPSGGLPRSSPAPSASVTGRPRRRAARELGEFVRAL